MTKNRQISILFLFFVFQFSYAQTNGFLKSLKECKHSVVAKDVKTRFNKMDSCYVGLSIPGFEATTLKEDTIDINKMLGNVIVINILSLGCGPCIAEMPGLNDLVKKYKGQNVVFLALTREKAGMIADFLNSGNEFLFQIIPDAKNIYYRQLDSFGFPRTIIVDKQGIIRSCFSGGFNSKAASQVIKDKIIPVVDRLLQE